MLDFDPRLLRTLYKPSSDSHKGQNGKLLIIGGSHLFHGASLWALKVSSRIVDMVFYSSVPENNELVLRQKEEFRDGIVVPRNRIKDYIKEADCVLIGPGLPRSEGKEKSDDDTKGLTERLLKDYPDKKWVIDGGSLQVVDPEILLSLKMPILTPHKKEFETLFKIRANQESACDMAKKYNCVILLKGEEDIICPPSRVGETGSKDKSIRIKGGNAGMTKGGTGDVLAGLTAALYCKNDAFLSACCASFINKKAGDELFKKVGYYFNATDLANKIPEVMKEYVIG